MLAQFGGDYEHAISYLERVVQSLRNIKYKQSAVAKVSTQKSWAIGARYREHLQAYKTSEVAAGAVQESVLDFCYC